MLFRTRRSLVVSLATLAILSASCGKDVESSNSELQTVIGRGGAFFDKRVQFINALLDPVGGNVCVYFAEYETGLVPKFEDRQSLTPEQSAFLSRVERESVPVTLYPVSIADLEYNLAMKDTERKLRGIISVPVGLSLAYLGLLPMFIAVAWTGSAAALLHPFILPYLTGALGGFGILNQATRDLSYRNQGIRVDNAVFNKGGSPRRANLGVTMAFVNSAQSLPPASLTMCPRNLTSDAVQPYALDLQNKYLSLKDKDRSSLASTALNQLRQSKGCHFSANNGNETTVYHAEQNDADGKMLHLSIYKIGANQSMSRIAGEDMKLQLSSDAGSGAKYISDSGNGSIAIWLSEMPNGSAVGAKLAHKLVSGEYADHRSFVSGTCNL